LEEPLPNGGSCLLGSINLSAYVENEQFNMEQFKKDIHIIVKGMNEVLDQGLPLHPLAIQRETVRDYRQIGIGIMGLADMLIKMGVQYDTDEALEVCDIIGFNLANESIKASALLAKEEGAYPKYKKEILRSRFLKNNTTPETYDLVRKYGLRNSQILTIAPTGTLSTMLGISGGIEPIFSLSYTRKTESLHGEDVYYKVFTPIADKYMKEHGLTEEEQLPNFFVTAQTLNPFKRVEMQGVWQNHIDASISSTVNLPHETTVEEVEDLYIHAWEKD
jgi:ribonucleoside-diphosphate reductase alpha chain